MPPMSNRQRNGSVAAGILSLHLLVCASCRERNENLAPVSRRTYSHSAEYSEQLIYLSETIALAKQSKSRAEDSTLDVNYSIVSAHFGGEPDHEWASGDVVDNWLVTGIQRIASIKNGHRLLMDTGTDLPSNPRYSILDLQSGRVTSGSSITDLLAQVGETAGSQFSWWQISLFFDKSRDVRERTQTPLGN